MKKIMTLFLVAALSLSCLGVMAEETPESPREDFPGQLALTLLQAVTDTSYFTETAEGNITRADFLYTLSSAMGWNNGSSVPAQYFSDVPSTHYAAASLQTACDAGYVAKAETFGPSEPIKLSDALKLSVCGSGYMRIAEAAGGYPTGYRLQAAEIGLMKDLKDKSAELLSYRDAAVLLYNVLTVDLLRPSSLGEQEIYEKTKDQSLLTEIHKVYQADGIVTATPVSRLTSNSGRLAADIFELDGEVFHADFDTSALLGRRVKAFYQDDQDARRVIAAVPYKNAELTLSGADLEYTGGTELRLYDEAQSKTIRYSLSANYQLIYNGRVWPSHGGAWLTSETGDVTLLDNNGDDIYEVVFVTEEQYMVLSSVSDLSKTLYDSNRPEMFIDLSDSDNTVEVFDNQGKKINWYTLKGGDVVAVAATKDQTNRLTRIRVISSIVSGTVTAVDSVDGRLTIEGKSYRQTPYFKAVYGDFTKGDISIGSSYYFIVDQDKIVSLSDADAGMKYGYLIKSGATSGIRSEIEVKLLTTSGKPEIFKLAEKVQLDGGKRYSATSWEIADQLATPQLIRFKLNEAGELSSIDTAEEAGPRPFDQIKPADNSLTYFPYESAPKYKSNTKMLYPYANIEATQFFVLPASASFWEEDEKFSVVSYSALDLRNEKQYAVELYDISREGSAAVAVYRNDTVFDGSFDGSATALVEKVTDLAEGQKKLHLVMAGKYAAYLMNDDVKVSKASGKPLGAGDLIRFTTYADGTIRSLTVDYDGAASVPNNASIFNALTTNNYAAYIMGRVYSMGSNYLYFAPADSANAVCEFDWKKLYNVRKSGNVLLFDTTTKVARIASDAEIVQHLGGGDQASFIIARVDQYFDTKLIVIYR